MAQLKDYISQAENLSGPKNKTLKSIKLPFSFGGRATSTGLSKCGKGIICDEIDKIPVITCKYSI